MKKILFSIAAIIGLTLFISCSNNPKQETTTIETKDTTATVKEEKVEIEQRTSTANPGVQQTTTTTKEKTNTVEVGPNGVKVIDGKTNVTVNKNGVSTTTKEGTEVKVSSKSGVKISF